MIETLGGVFEVAEDMAKLLRREFDEVRFIVPNVAKSAGTILCMSGDEILMDHRSALGPIDPQFRGIRAFAAQDFLSGFDAIKAEVDEKKSLNLAYVPMLQQISPADLEACRIATKLSQEFVAEWLCKYMFRDSRDAEKKLLTAKRRRNMARRAARTLCDRSKWLSHARSVKIDDLKEIWIKVIDYTKDYGKTGANLWKLWLTCLYQFRASTTTKIFQNDKINFFEHVNVQSRRPGPTDQQAQVPKLDASTKHVNIMVECDKCGMPHHFQLNFVPNEPLTPGHEVFPAQDKFQCKNCEYNHDISGIRLQLEGNVGKKSER